MDEYILLGRSWVEVDLGQLVKNYEVYKNTISNNQNIMVVVKANAYGHGDVKIAKKLQDIGVFDFAVSNIEEACVLRNSGIEGQILVLGYTPIEYVTELLKYDITQAIVSEEYGEALIGTGQAVKCQYAIDTGMNRIGLNAKELNRCINIIRRAKKYLNLNGIFSHLCYADTDTVEANLFTEYQISLFRELVKGLEDLDLKYIHIFNSAGGLRYSYENNDLIRLGIVLYGLKPDCNYVLPEGIEPILSWKSVISMVKTVNSGETIGYGRSYKVNNKMKVATVSTGYADGYNRGLSNKGYVLVKGKKAPIVGRVCMDQFMIDVSEIDDISAGDEVVLIGRDGNNKVTADDMAYQLGTIGYEVICCIGKRVPRLYI